MPEYARGGHSSTTWTGHPSWSICCESATCLRVTSYRPPQALHGISIATISRMSINVPLIPARVFAGLVLLYSDHGSRVRAGIVRYSRLSDCPLTSFRQRVEVTTALVRHTRAGQFVEGVQHAPPFG